MTLNDLNTLCALNTLKTHVHLKNNICIKEDQEEAVTIIKRLTVTTMMKTALSELG